MRRKIFWMAIMGFCLAAPIASASARVPDIVIVKVADAIGPGVAEFVEDTLQAADPGRTACVVIALDTPGGAVESMRKIVQAMYACAVPVVVFVSPAGARAASAGVMITMAADIAAMAPGTNIGAAHPVAAGGKEMGETMTAKVTNDMVAFAKSVAARRGRNEVWVEKAVRDSVSATAEEALLNNVVDLVAEDLEDLIQKINGREVAGKGRLDLDKAVQRHIDENLRTKVLKTISDPNIAYVLFLIGLAGLYFELSHPGAVFPGVVGGLALILAFYAFSALPVNTVGVLLILLAVVLFILELKVTSYGLLSVAGVISMVLGSLMLFKGAGPQFQVAWQVFLPTVLLISAFFIGVATVVFKAQVHPPMTGADGLVGEIGVVQQIDGREGKVRVHGELWQARFNEAIPVGGKVRVIAVHGLVVTVAAASDAPNNA